MSVLIKPSLNPDRATLRSFGFIALGGFSALAVCAWQRWLIFEGLGDAASTVALSLAALGAACASLSLVAPQANRPLYLLLSLATYPIGVVVSHLIMATLYFGLFAPIAILFRLLGRDPLERRFDPSAESYWTTHRKARSKEDYFRQY
jgi:hypothetical protein